MIMTTKKYKCIPYFALVLTLIVPIMGINNAWALDSSYYLAMYNVTDEEINQLRQDILVLEKQIETLTETEAVSLQEEIVKKNEKIALLTEKLDEIQKQSIALFEVDEETKAKLYGIEKTLIDKYINEQSGTYAGENPVLLIVADLEKKGIAVVFNIEKTDRNSVENKVPNIISDVLKEAKDVPVSISYSKLELFACDSRTSPCVPRIGGISVAEAGDPASASSTLGYRSKNSAGEIGFLMAGHAIDTVPQVGTVVKQPGGSSTTVGSVTQWKKVTNQCDCAFVKANAGITVDASIYTAPNTARSIIYRQTDAFQPPGQIVKISGLTSGVLSGPIYSNSPNVNYNLITMTPQGGDSGAPVYIDNGATNAWLYGMVYAGVVIDGQVRAAYYPQDHIKAQFGLTE